MFEKASRLKLRFSVTGVGNLSAEDLWDLSQTKLNSIYMALSAVSKNAETESLLESSAADEVLTLKKDIVRHVFNTKKAERLAREDAEKIRDQINRLLEIKAQKQDEALSDLTEDEILTMIQELEQKS